MEDLIEYNNKRITRAGKEQENFLLNLKKGDRISGMMAMKIKDHYGIKPVDVVFMMMTRDVDIEMGEFYSLLQIEEDQRKTLRQCAKV